MPNDYYDALGQWVQVSASPAGRLVRIVSLVGGNRYLASVLSHDASGTLQPLAGQLTVTNLGEPPTLPGQTPAGTDALALDVDGRWIVCIRQAGSAMFPARVTASAGGSVYTLREQSYGTGGFAPAAGSADISAINLAEINLGPGAAVDVGTIVLAMTLSDHSSSVPTVRYVFAHPLYAKYLD